MKVSLLIVAALLVAGTETSSAQSAAGWGGGGSFEIVPSPNTGPQAAGNTLLAVDALSPTDAWAVGFHYNNPGFCTFCPAPLAIHWDGAQWSLVATPAIAVPKVELTSVAAVSSDDAWAVGYSYNPNCGLCSDTLIEHWDGSSWSVVPSPNPGMDNRLYGVSATSANDIWAVGNQWPNWSTKHPLILHFDGAAWTVVDSPQINQGRLDAVHALAPDDAWAVGPGLALHWDGVSWTPVAIPSQTGEYVEFTGVSGIASDDVWVVGNFKYSSQSGQVLSSARAYHWDGLSWTAVFPGVGGQDSRMYGVHTVASNDAWAVGGEPGPYGSGVAFRYVTVHWDGVSWSNVPNPNKGVVYGVSASSSSDVWAVGFGFDSLGFSTGTYTLRYDPEGDCHPDCDGSGLLTVLDFGCFQTRFVLQDPYGDCNEDGQLTVADFGCFQSKFVSGCP